MTIKNNTAIIEFHKWAILVGIPAIIILQLDNRQKLEDMNLLLNRHDVKIENTIQVDDSQNKRLDKFDDRFNSLDQEAYKLSFIQKHSR